MPYHDHQYNDPIHIIWRKGTADDPYVDRAEYLKVVNNLIVLSEIPDSFYRVRISGFNEVNLDKITSKSLKPNEFAVSYSTGIIQLHESQEAQSLNVFYKGRGLIQYPSTRIYHQDDYNNVVKSLYEIINESLNSVEFLKESIDGKTSDYREIRDILLGKIDDINVAIDTANNAGDKAEIATDKALNAYNTTRLVFKPYVNTYGEIGYMYPNPEVGWTTQVYNTGIRYRYDGIDWVPIDLFGGSIPTANEDRDGIMSKETYNQIQEIEQNVTNLESRPRNRIITFCFPYLNGGVNSIIARFPFVGTIQSVRGICSTEGTDVLTEIDIEKSSDMTNWTSIFDSSYLTFDVNSNFDNGKHILLGTGVALDDMFRVNVRTLSGTIEGVTIEINISVD